VLAMVEQLVDPISPDATPMRDPRRVNILPGCHLTPGDIDELRDLFEAFGLVPVFVPDLSGSLDGHIPQDFTPTTLGGTTVEQVRTMGLGAHTIAIGEQMRSAAQALESRTGVAFRLFDRLTGLAACDELMQHLSALSGRPVPAKYRGQRGQLIDAMLDGHFHIGGRRIAIAAEPDLLFALAGFLQEMGGEIVSAVTSTASPMNARVPTEVVTIGDLEDMEAQASAHDAQIIITHSHGRQAAARLGLPHFRIGLPMFDALGAGHLVSVGYKGTRDLIFSIGNMLMHSHHEASPNDWRDAWNDHNPIKEAAE
jgi:nitrogenase molybdenum-iron protein NifN